MPQDLSCKTKYPILLVHGLGFRDRAHPCYWGRIPETLEQRGARVFYGGQDAWGSIEGNAQTLRSSLLQVLAETGADKVNLIAHSKGGLEARYLASTLRMGPRIASITTISTPHHGSKAMDLFYPLPRPVLQAAGFFVNLWFRALGDRNPDFVSVCRAISTKETAAFNRRNPDYPEIFYQSFAAEMPGWRSDFFMAIPYLIVSHFDGECDGMVGIESAKWGEFRGVLRGTGKRGVSHPDAVDARRRNFRGEARPDGTADIRGAYVRMVQELKEAGY